jgi:NAD(P)-dependent dehydrogenase (short-subunit alcohol dehydrogenase family)
MNMTNQTAMVTGAGRGIGRAIALAFARAGANLVLLSRTAQEVSSVGSEVEALGCKALVFCADVGNGKDILRVTKEAASVFGGIDVLVNNAGIALAKPFLETTDDDWDKTLNTNLRGAVNCIRAVLPGMIERGSGRIINIASGAGLRGLPNDTAYAASKAGIVALTFSLAGEVNNAGVRINVICPGPVETRQLQQSGNKDLVLKLGNAAMQPEDVAGAAVFLASGLSGDMNGQVINVRTTNRW